MRTVRTVTSLQPWQPHLDGARSLRKGEAHGRGKAELTTQTMVRRADVGGRGALQQKREVRLRARSGGGGRVAAAGHGISRPQLGEGSKTAVAIGGGPHASRSDN